MEGIIELKKGGSDASQSLGDSQMVKHTTANKDFDSCRKGNLRINPSNGAYTCISKESPTAKKFNESLCELFNCPYFEAHNKEKTTPLKEKIKKYIKEDKPEAWIIENAPCSRTYYFKIKKEVEDERNKEDEQIRSKINIETPSEIAPEPSPVVLPNQPQLNGTPHPTGTILQNPSKTVTKLYRPIKYKLNLLECNDALEGISYAIEKFYSWSSNNYIEFVDYIKNIRNSIENPQLLRLIDSLTTLYIRAHTQRGVGGWGGGVSIYRSSYSSGLIYGERTYAEVFHETGLPFPDELKEQRNEIVEDRGSLYRSGIFDDLIKAIRVELSHDNYLESQYTALMEGTLNLAQQKELALKIVNNKEVYKNDSYFKMVWDELGLNRPEDRQILLAHR